MEQRRGDHGWLRSLDGKAGQGDKPFFLWYNSTAMHFGPTSQKKPRQERAGRTKRDRMVTHDEQIGEVLKKLDELGVRTTPSSCIPPTTGPENEGVPSSWHTVRPGALAADRVSLVEKALTDVHDVPTRCWPVAR